MSMADNAEQFGIHHSIGASVDRTRLPEMHLVPMPPRTAKFTLSEWQLQKQQLHRVVLDQQHLADRIMLDINRLKEEKEDLANVLKDNSDHCIGTRFGEIEYSKRELEIKLKEIMHETENLEAYKTRLQNYIANITTSARVISQKCLQLRDGRIGIDLTFDPVEDALQNEITTVLGAETMLNRALEHLNEQIRELRSNKSLVERDLQYKQVTLDLDRASLKLKATDTCLSVYEGYSTLNPAYISSEEYTAFTQNNVIKAGKAIAGARNITQYLEGLMNQVFDDLIRSKNHCDEEFRKRVTITRIALKSLEVMHKETTEKVLAMKDSILEIKKALVGMEKNVALAHTRLGKRAQRVATELVNDAGGQALYYECEMLRRGTEEMQQMYHEATSSLRYLLQAQLKLEEDINVKMNTVKIDEVDCLTIRKSMIFQKY